MDTASGFFNVHKPLGMTSHDVVAKIRRGLKLKKVGHAGTLDPLASGVLIICVGHATRLSDYVMHMTKRYHADVCLGVTTETYDAEGAVQQVRDPSQVTRDSVVTALKPFLGDIEQIPPMYSAIKQGGKKLYDLARAGETVEREARRVRIDSLDLIEWSPPHFTVNITCSAGTYIRSLAYDLGEALNVGAHLAGLTRLSSGTFTLEQAVTLDMLLSSDQWKQYVVTPQQALPHWPILNLDADQTAHMLQGRAFAGSTEMTSENVFAVAPDGRLLGVLEARGGRYRPHKVFS